ncbi:hypothetical protein GO300_03812 [Ralstonia solanacearum]|nr:hypothetical protein [Ralstonia solanacearum]
MDFKKLCAMTAFALLSTAALGAEVTQIVCNVGPNSADSYFLHKGVPFDVPMNKLEQDGSDYVLRDWFYRSDALRISRSTGKFSYNYGTRLDDAARVYVTGTCDATEQKLKF